MERITDLFKKNFKILLQEFFNEDVFVKMLHNVKCKMGTITQIIYLNTLFT